MSDLKASLQDGTTFVTLVEILGNDINSVRGREGGGGGGAARGEI